MEVEVDHYVVLGLPSGEEGASLSDQEINKAYRSKARELHPDKRPDDSNAHANFLKLQNSYQVLKDDKARKLFDDLLRIKREKIQRQGQHDSKRRKMMSDLEERERSAFAVDSHIVKAREEEERICRQLKLEISRIIAMHSNKKPAPSKKDTTASALDKTKVVKVSWEKTGVDYSAERLREIFGEFGSVEDVVIKSSKKRVAALVVMSTKDATIAATVNALGDHSNPLVVVPLIKPAASSPAVFCAEKNMSLMPQNWSVLALSFEMKIGHCVRKYVTK